MFALIKDNVVVQYPYSISTFRKDNPSVSLPLNPKKHQLEDQGIYEVAESIIPVAEISQIVEEKTPTLQDGVWTRTWVIRDATEIELSMAKQKVKDDVVQATQLRLDTFAQTRGYDGILSAATYATSTVPKFQAEGQYCVEARDATWNKLYEMLAEVEAGTRPMPNSFADVEPELPVLNWPN